MRVTVGFHYVQSTPAGRKSERVRCSVEVDVEDVDAGSYPRVLEFTAPREAGVWAETSNRERVPHVVRMCDGKFFLEVEDPSQLVAAGGRGFIDGPLPEVSVPGGMSSDRQSRRSEARAFAGSLKCLDGRFLLEVPEPSLRLVKSGDDLFVRLCLDGKSGNLDVSSLHLVPAVLDGASLEEAYSQLVVHPEFPAGSHLLETALVESALGMVKEASWSVPTLSVDDMMTFVDMRDAVTAARRTGSTENSLAIASSMLHLQRECHFKLDEAGAVLARLRLHMNLVGLDPVPDVDEADLESLLRP